MSNMGEIIIAFITGVISPVTILLVKNWLEKRKKPDMVAETLKVSEIVYSKIDDIREEMGANRVWITQFHNGGNFYPTGKSIQKFSIFYEHVTPGTETIKETFSNIPTSLFVKPLSELYNLSFCSNRSAIPLSWVTNPPTS